jgi:hypothetical protein
MSNTQEQLQNSSNATSLTTFYALVMSSISRPYHVGLLGGTNGRGLLDVIEMLASKFSTIYKLPTSSEVITRTDFTNL